MLVDANAAWVAPALLPLQTTLRYIHELALALLPVSAATVLFNEQAALTSLVAFFVPARLVVAGPMMLPAVQWSSLPAWLGSQVVTGAVFACCFRLIYRHDLSQLPVTTAT